MAMQRIPDDTTDVVNAEAGSYRHHGMESGSTTRSADGNTYWLDRANGAWMATFLPI